MRGAFLRYGEVYIRWQFFVIFSCHFHFDLYLRHVFAASTGTTFNCKPLCINVMKTHDYNTFSQMSDTCLVYQSVQASPSKNALLVLCCIELVTWLFFDNVNLHILNVRKLLPNVRHDFSKNKCLFIPTCTFHTLTKW